MDHDNSTKMFKIDTNFKVRIPLEVFGFAKEGGYTRGSNRDSKSDSKPDSSKYFFTVRLQKSYADGHVSTSTVRNPMLMDM